jgi:hypothetical protein
MGMERYVSRLKSLIHLLLIMCFSNIFEVITMAVSNMRATLLYPIEVVWDTVTNLNDFSWRSDLKDVRIIDENNFIEITKNGVETYFRIIECIKYQSWIFEIENKNIKGTWVGKFYVEDDKTILDFTENVVSKKLIFKPFISLYLKRQQRIYFKDLKVKLNCKEASFI